MHTPTPRVSGGLHPGLQARDTSGAAGKGNKKKTRSAEVFKVGEFYCQHLLPRFTGGCERLSICTRDGIDICYACI